MITPQSISSHFKWNTEKNDGLLDHKQPVLNVPSTRGFLLIKPSLIYEHFS